MKPKTSEILNPLSIFNDAVRKTVIHLDDSKPDGRGGKFFFRCEEDLEKARDALDQHSHGTKRLKDLFYYEQEIRSDYLIRSHTFGRAILSELPFTVDGQIDLVAAQNTLLDRNDTWFKKRSDIVNVEVHTIPKKPYDVYLLDIYLSKDAYWKVTKGIKKGMNLDCETKQLKIYVPTPVETCLRCHSPHHHATNCNNEIRCKWCISKHLDGEECTSKANPTCYRCRDVNMQLPPGVTKREENHHAASPRCPDIKAARRQNSRNISRPKPRYGGGRTK